MPGFEELQRICLRLLNNADLDVSFDTKTGDILLNFTWGPFGERVEFRCGRFHSLKFTKDPGDIECFFVGETTVRVFVRPKDIRRMMASEGWKWNEKLLPSQLYLVNVQGGVEITLLCVNFTWNHIRCDVQQPGPPNSPNTTT